MAQIPRLSQRVEPSGVRAPQRRVDADCSNNNFSSYFVVEFQEGLAVHNGARRDWPHPLGERNRPFGPGTAPRSRGLDLVGARLARSRARMACPSAQKELLLGSAIDV